MIIYCRQDINTFNRPGYTYLLTGMKRYCAVGYLEKKNTSYYLIANDEGSPEWLPCIYFYTLGEIQARPLSGSWRFIHNYDPNGTNSTTLITYPSLIHGGIADYENLLLGTFTKAIEFRDAYVLESARDDVIDLVFRWSRGEINHLEVSLAATEMIDGRVGKALAKDDNAITVLAELMAVTTDETSIEVSNSLLSKL